jgi:hypothetical protein
MFASLNAPAAAAPLDAGHPIIGHWKIALGDGRCSEAYRIRADGTMHVTSADEVADSQFEITAQPSAKGFYKWSDRVTQDNGGKDCSGEVTQVGHESTYFVVFNPDEDVFLMCQAEDISTCFGPFVRQPEPDA